MLITTFLRSGQINTKVSSMMVGTFTGRKPWPSRRDLVEFQNKPNYLVMTRMSTWDQCSPEEKKLYARMMEVFAGFLEHLELMKK